MTILRWIALGLILLTAGIGHAEPLRKPSILFTLTKDHGAELSVVGTSGVSTAHEPQRLLAQSQAWALRTNDRYSTLKPPPADNWVATDALGRSLPGHKETGDRRAEKYVGLFYFVWVGNHTQKVYDISKILEEQDESKRQWGPAHAYHFGCEPEQGYYHAADPWVIRRDMQMLVNADVDFLFLDVTNGLIYEDSVDALLAVIGQMRAEGIPAPQVTFVTNAASGRIMNRLYERFYKDPKRADLWFRWEGRPLIFGIADDPVLRKDVAEHFTIKRSWAWTATKKEPNHWQWLDSYPQDYGWSEFPEIPEQIPVAAASHASNSIGKSYRDGSQPPVGPKYLTEHTHRGLFFEEQWGRAHEVDPKVVMISGWNEWIAARFIKKDQPEVYAGRPTMKDGSWFVDVLTPEFSRDIAPMRGGYTDNYYYQMVGHIRRFKGISAPPERPQPRSIQIDGQFDDWKGVSAVYQDPPGDTMHRSFRGTDPNTTYTNNTGRNDIVSARVVESDGLVNFMVRTANALTPHSDANWMVLLIDKDQNKTSGWEGYDLAINWKATSRSVSTCANWIDGKWQTAGEIAIGYQGTHLELSVLSAFFAPKGDLSFDFKWIDNASLKSAEALFLEGDVAPDRRFNFRY
ncbi:MAG: hypothetical protein ACI8W8_004435 [Rhodothermales bacterium]|jgi:hypothetical protein